jgi:hypothetical protein
MGVGAGLAAAAVLSMGVLTRFPYTAEGDDQAELRLTWRARTAPVEECRRLTRAEQDALPVHMRREEVCEGRVTSYRLDVVVDGTPRHSSVVKGFGARGDRPLYVFDAIRLEPGQHDVHVVFERVGAGADGNAEAADARVAGVPDRLELRASVEMGPGDVALVTYDATGRRLELRRRPPRS